MSKSKILIVEDERITAEDLKITLENLGYEVTGIASSADTFYHCLESDLPDLVLMDIYLKGNKDGIELAIEIKDNYNLPVIYLTAYSDSNILDRAKVTEPFGFILKPFQERELHSNIEMALHKNRMEKRINHLNSILKVIRDVNQLIVTINDTKELLQKTCETLISTRAYSSAWFLILDQDKEYLDAASAGLNDSFEGFIQQYQDGYRPDCIEYLNKNNKTIYSMIDSLKCKGCPAFNLYPESGVIISKVQYQNRLFGYLNVTMPHTLVNDPEELTLFTEISDDLGLALNNLDQQKKKNKAEDALQKSETLFRHAFDYSATCMCIVGIDGKLQKTNTAFSSLFGYSEDELTEMNINDISHPDDLNIGFDYLRKLTREELERTSFEKRYISKNKKTIWALVSVSLVRDDFNLPKFFIIHLIDLTERKLAEQELQKLSQVVQQSPDSIVVTDINGTIEYANPAASHISGYSNEELIGNNPRILSSGEMTKEEYRVMWDMIKAGNEWKGEFHNRRKNGELYWERASISPIFNQKGEISQFLGVKEDITERKHNENIQKVLFNISRQVFETTETKQLLENIKNELNVLIDTRNFYVAIYNEDTGMLISEQESDEKDTITSWPAEKSLTGYVIKRNKSLLLKREDVNKLVESGEVELIGTASEIWLGVPLTVDGKPYGAFVVQDYHNPNAYGVNELKMLEFIASQIRLSIQRQKSILDLKNALVKAEAGDKLKTAFINNISHEIRTPLNGILGFTEMTLNPDSTPEDNELFFSIIKKSSKRLLSTVTSYMDISLLVSGTMETSRRSSNLDRLIKEIYSDFTEICSSKGIELKVRKHDSVEPLILHTDIEKLRKIISHLLDNAVKFTQTGSITFGYEINDNDIVFSVSDTGTGIKTDALNIIFDAFMQADVSPTRGYEGSGLGLSIAHGLVKLLGGKLWVDSERGSGSTFYFTLPVSENPILTLRKTTEIPRSKPSSKPLILVAEDDDSNFKYIEIVLLYAAYEVIRAENGIEAIECCRNHPEVRLVLMDIKMPLMDGFEATRQIKTFMPALPVIALTAHVTVEDENAAIAAGCNEYVTKPVSKARLLEIIENALTLN
jgi:PAS domain S-box-containing protein